MIPHEKEPVPLSKVFGDLLPERLQPGLGGQAATSPVRLGRGQVELARRVLDLLKREKQVVLEGPPGTSKTWTALCAIALELGALETETGEFLWEELDRQRLQGEEGRWEVVQFHAGMSYEDFVAGLEAEPAREGGGLRFEVREKVFVRMCRLASKRPGLAHFLLLDEVNRAPLEKVLGQLLFALEYRGRGVHAPPLEERLTVPENLYVLATMNSADKNVGDIDHALRRRFAFFRLKPDPSLLREYLERAGLEDSEVEEIATVFEKLIEYFGGREDYAVGHTYFFVKGGDWRRDLRYRVDHRLLPLLREYVEEGVLTREEERQIEALLGGLTESKGGLGTTAGAPTDETGDTGSEGAPPQHEETEASEAAR